MTFPEKIEQREKYIFDRVMAGTFEAKWVDISYDILGRKVKLQVMEDALKIDGVRVNVSASLQQRLADVFDASLMTAQVADLVYINAIRKIGPFPMKISTSVSAMKKHSSGVDVKLKTLSVSEGLVADPGKNWILDKKLESSPRRACNYGWHFLGSSYSGISGFSVASKFNTINYQPIKVIQPNAIAHDAFHSDYSQVCQLVSQICWVDGIEKRFSELLIDPKDSVLVSHQGPLKLIRQPGIQVVQGYKIMFPVIITQDLPIV